MLLARIMHCGHLLIIMWKMSFHFCSGVGLGGGYLWEVVRRETVVVSLLVWQFSLFPFSCFDCHGLFGG